MAMIYGFAKARVQMSSNKLQHRYVFEKNGDRTEFCVDDSFFYDGISADSSLPEWTRLEYHQCRNCPLNIKEHSHCPVAIDIMPVIDWSAAYSSFDHVTLHVISNNRNYTADTTVQKGMSSLIGLIMSLGKCPKMEYFKPMGMFHMPLANKEETIVRAISFALTRELVKEGEAGSCVNAVEKMVSQYNELQMVNIGFAERIKSAGERDAAVNALVRLDLFGKIVPQSIETAIADLVKIFEK